MRVLFLTNVPSPYRVDFFNELGKKCDLTVLFERQSAKSRDDKWIAGKFHSFNGIFLNGVCCGDAEAVCPSVTKYLSKKKYDCIIVGMYSSPTGMIAIETLRKKKIPFILSSDGGIIKNESKFRMCIKRHFISAASMWLSTGTQTTEYFKYYGADVEQIRVYPFTSVWENEVLTTPVDQDKKYLLREKINIKEEKVILSVGQFIYRKGYDLLIKACKNLNQDIGVYIVGGKPTVEYLLLINEYNLKNVHFVGFKTKKELKEFYMAADLFVLPTREDIWGLVINEAMTYGLPVITTDGCVAGMEMVIDGWNGNIVPVDDIQSLHDVIVGLIYDKKKLEIYASHCLETARSYTIERMSRAHLDIIRDFVDGSN